MTDCLNDWRRGRLDLGLSGGFEDERAVRGGGEGGVALTETEEAPLTPRRK